MSSKISANFLTSIGLPTSLTSIMLQVWNTTRIIQYSSACHQDPLRGSCTPQGCPLAPLTLACWMTNAQQWVQNQMAHIGYSESDVAAASTRIFMDDRTFVDNEVDRLFARADLWLQWSRANNLLEHEDKPKQWPKLEPCNKNFTSQNQPGLDHCWFKH